MRTGRRFGFLSLLCGTVACGLFIALAYFSRLPQLRGGYLLKVFDQLGWVSKERSYIVELKASSIFALNDANAVLWLTWIGFLIAFFAVALALYAEYRHEATLCLSSGFIVATAGLWLQHPLLMLVIQAVGALALLGLRRQGAIKA